MLYIQANQKGQAAVDRCAGPVQEFFVVGRWQAGFSIKFN